MIYPLLKLQPYYTVDEGSMDEASVDVIWWGRGGVVVSALDFRSEGQWFDSQSLPSCCFLRQDTLPHIVFLHPGV